MPNMKDLDCEPFITRVREWDVKFTPRTHKFKKTFTNGKGVEEEAIIDNRTYGLEFSNGKNIASFMETQKTLVNGNGELSTAFARTLEDSRKDLWNNVIENKYKHDPANVPGLQTTTNFKKALQEYQEAIVNKAQLRDVQIGHL